MLRQQALRVCSLVLIEDLGLGCQADSPFPTAASTTASGQSSPSSSSSSSSPSPDPLPSPKPTPAQIAGIAIGCFAIVAGIVVGWWKKHQVLYLITCGKRGSKRSDKKQQAEQGHELSGRANGGANNMGGIHITNHNVGWRGSVRL